MSSNRERIVGFRQLFAFLCLIFIPLALIDLGLGILHSWKCVFKGRSALRVVSYILALQEFAALIISAILVIGSKHFSGVDDLIRWSGIVFRAMVLAASLVSVGLGMIVAVYSQRVSRNQQVSVFGILKAMVRQL